MFEHRPVPGSLDKKGAMGVAPFKPVNKYNALVRIQKPVVTYDLGKFSVTNCARFPNYF
jgi:hypothetical protein